MTQRVVNICYHCDHSVEQAGSHDEQIFHPLRSDMGKTKCKLPAKGHIAGRQDNAREGVQALSRGQSGMEHLSITVYSMTLGQGISVF